MEKPIHQTREHALLTWCVEHGQKPQDIYFSSWPTFFGRAAACVVDMRAGCDVMLVPRFVHAETMLYDAEKRSAKCMSGGDDLSDGSQNEVREKKILCTFLLTCYLCMEHMCDPQKIRVRIFFVHFWPCWASYACEKQAHWVLLSAAHAKKVKCRNFTKEYMYVTKREIFALLRPKCAFLPKRAWRWVIRNFTCTESAFFWWKSTHKILHSCTLRLLARLLCPSCIVSTHQAHHTCTIMFYVAQHVVPIVLLSSIHGAICVV